MMIAPSERMATEPPYLAAWRCNGQRWEDGRPRPCGKLLGYAVVGPGSAIKIHCRQCGTWNLLQVAAPRTG